MDVINAMFISSVIGLILAAPAFVSELFRRGKNLPLLIDVQACWGRRCTPEETFFLSLFTHLLLELLFGAGYMLLVLLGWWFHDFRFLSILLYGGAHSLLIGLIIFPLVRIGVFGRREGSFVWVEFLFSRFLTAVGFWAAFRLFPIFLP